MNRTSRQKHRFPIRVATGAGALTMAAAIAALAPNGNFALTFVYVACTLGVCAVTTFVTIRVLTRLWQGQSGNPESGNPETAGMVEIGLLIGLFVVSPLTLTGAFQLLAAVVGSL